MNFDFGAAISQGWHIMWRNKGLWILGILAACGSSGNFSSPNSGGNTSFSGNGNNGDFNNFGQDPNFQRAMDFFQEVGPAIIVGLICLGLLIGLVVFVVGLLGRGGLLGGTKIALTNGTEKVSFSEAWSAGMQNIGRLFMVWLFTSGPIALLGVLMLIIGVIGGVGILTSARRGSEEAIAGSAFALLACLAPLACIAGLAGIAASILNHMGNLAAIFDDASGWGAVKRGWEVLRQNPVPLVAMGAIFWIVRSVIGLILAIPAILIIVPGIIAIAGAAASDNAALMTGGVLFTLLCACAYAPVAWTAQGMFETWTSATWSVTYTRVATPPSAPSIPQSPTFGDPPPVSPVNLA